MELRPRLLLSLDDIQCSDTEQTTIADDVRCVSFLLYSFGRIQYDGSLARFNSERGKTHSNSQKKIYDKQALAIQLSAGSPC